MKLHKKVLKSSYFLNIMCWFISLYIRFIYHTTNWHVEGREEFDKFDNEEGAYIVTFWHGRLIMPIRFFPKRKQASVLISSHGDGKFIAKVMHFFNAGVIEGSSSKGGVTALKKIFQEIKKGNRIAITPDGPRGPRMHVNGSIIEIAKKFSIPVIPVTFATKKHRIIKSWDRFFIPFPFGKGIFIYGKPISASEFSDKSDYDDYGKRLLQDRLNELTNKADNFVGIEPIMPEEVQ